MICPGSSFVTTNCSRGRQLRIRCIPCKYHKNIIKIFNICMCLELELFWTKLTTSLISRNEASILIDKKLRSSLYTLQTRNTCRSFIKKRKESMKRNVGKAINIINACSFHPCTGKKALRVKRSNRLYWSPCVAARSGLALSSIPSVPPHKKVQIYIRSPFIYIFSKKY